MFAACDAYLRAVSEAPSRSRLLDGRPDRAARGARARRAASAGSCSIGASPGIADPAERAARAASDAALADRIEAIGIEAFVREWEAQPLFAGMPRGVADLARADRLRNTAGGLAARCAGWARA